MAGPKPLTVGELRRRLDDLPDHIPVMAEVSSASMALAQAASRHAHGGDEGATHQELDELQRGNGSAWVIGAERFDQDQAGGADGLLLLTE